MGRHTAREGIELRIQWAKSPWGFDSPLSHQHRDLLRGRISDLRVPCAKPSAGLLDASPPACRCARRGKETVRYRVGPGGGGGGGGVPAGGGGMLEGAFAVLV